MDKAQLTNSQFFHKFRFGDPCPPSDFHIVCHGNLVESTRCPESFYNGWYPVRHQCSYPSHEVRPGAGLATEKGLRFRNNRIICHICDHPENLLLPVVKEKPCCCNSVVNRNSVAPRTCEPDIACQRMLGHKTKVRENCAGAGIADRYWRYHDPHCVDPISGISRDSRVHEHNWFKRQMANDNKYKFDQQVYQRCQQQLHLLNRDSKVTCTAASPRQFCRQRVKRSAPQQPPPACNNITNRDTVNVLPIKLSMSSANP